MPFIRFQTPPLGLIFCILLWLVAPLARAAETTETIAMKQRFEARTFKDWRGRTLNYRLLKPLGYDAKKAYPLILFLHGAGERGTDNALQLNYFGPVIASDEMMKKYPCFVLAPQAPPEERWAALDFHAERGKANKRPARPMSLTLALLGKIRKEFTIDEHRIYITGLSMGGFGTWDILWRRPELFAAGVPICGGGDEAKAPLIAKTPVWVFHGAQDPIVMVCRSRNMVEAVKKAGGTVRYTEYPQEGHGSWGPAYADPQLYAWLFAQQRP